ncbi:DUF1206 domain-containing protein [Halobacillus salinarum]|uniref:DUF1206 domain-containing protein n=1 Tax=Halobacillus salinarum TaxID=2932257 RepID=A0ABY4ENA3_9BACI|nr:DUF1206 domain-containing protein [Halobacillus salinarum]UOQ45936.1 DUF1206 domain-containing protein [Halobacillus salinarum]
MNSTESISSKASDAKEEIKPWIRRLARVGYMAKGMVYAMVGILALMAAVGTGGKTTGTTGMMRSLATVPFGNLLLWMIGIGLIFYIIWVFIKAIKDPKNEGADAKGLIARTGYFVSGIIYGGLAYQAIKIAMNAGGGGGGSKQTISTKLLSHPYGPWIIGALGVIIVGYGLFELLTGVSQKFLNQFRVQDMNSHEKKIARNSGTLGLAARGTVLGLVGFFFIQTAVTKNPEDTKGLDGALSEVSQKPFGQWLLGLVALGLILYGVYQVTRGRYEHMSFGKRN